jgi:hypothetical protein
MSDEQSQREPDPLVPLFRTVKPVALGIIVLAVGLAVVNSVRALVRAYDGLRADGLTDAVGLDILNSLLWVSGVLAAGKSASNGLRMYAASVASSTDRKRALDPLTGYRRSARVGSPTLRFATAVLPVFFSLQFILGTVVIARKQVPIHAEVLPHYGSMFFLGLTFLTLSSKNSRFEGVALSSADREEHQVGMDRQSIVYGFGLRMIGIWAGVLGTWMVVDALALAYRLDDAVGFWHWFCLVAPLPYIYFSAAVQGAAKNILRYSRRHLTRVIRSPSDLDRESFVLYLRTFRSDNLQAGFQRGGQTSVYVSPLASGRSEEEQVAVAFRPIGPMVAAGRPGESLPHAGALRMYLPPENWQEPVRELMARARMVVIVLGQAEGTRWEVQEALRLLPPERLVLLVPSQAEDYLPFFWADLKADGARVQLPAYPGISRFGAELQAVITFAPGWRPEIGCFNQSPFRPASYRNLLLPALKYQLRPAFRRLAEYEQHQAH